MRKGLFAFVLVLASFAGGAVVNGPGLRWAKDQILGPPGASDPAAKAGADPVVELELPAAPLPLWSWRGWGSARGPTRQ